MLGCLHGRCCIQVAKPKDWFRLFLCEVRVMPTRNIIQIPPADNVMYFPRIKFRNHSISASLKEDKGMFLKLGAFVHEWHLVWISQALFLLQNQVMDSRLLYQVLFHKMVSELDKNCWVITGTNESARLIKVDFKLYIWPGTEEQLIMIDHWPVKLWGREAKR